MRLRTNSGDRLCFSGIPGDSAAFLVPPLVGIGFLVGGYVLGWLSNEWILKLLIGIPCSVIGVFVLAMGTYGLTLRERLILDKVTGEGEYRRISVMTRHTEEHIRFHLAEVHGVRLWHREEGVASQGRWHFIWEVALLIKQPRKSIILMEDQSDRGKRAQAAASTVADFLECELISKDDDA